jgi:hypothetical protein
MKSPWIVISAALALCALLLGYEWQSSSNRLAALQAQVAQLTADNTRLNASLSTETEKDGALEAESDQLRAARAMASDRIEPDAEPDTTPGPAPTPVADAPQPREGFMTRMFKDPGMQKILETQQAEALQQLYADYLKEAGLTDDQRVHFFQVLLDRQMALMGASESAISGGGVDMNAASAAASVASDALKGLLSPEQYDLFEKYEQSLGPRMQVARLNQQLSGIGAPLKDYQAAALIQIISQESTDLSALASRNQSDPTSMDEYARAVDAANQRICKRAQSILKPAQLAALAAFEKNMAATQIAALKMQRQMMNGE